MNAKLFQIRLLKRVLKREKRGVLDRDPPIESLILELVNAKLFRNVIRACAFKKCAHDAMHKRMGQSARADCAVEAKYHSQCAYPDRDWEGV